MKKIKNISFLILAIIIISCNDENKFDCLKNTGDIITENRAVSDFNEIDVDDKINLFINHDTVNKIVVEAGENLLESIKTSINDKTLTIRNKNKCNWVRSFENEINIYISVKELNKISYNGSGNITSTNTIESKNFTLDVWNGSGNIDISINSELSYINMHTGYAEVKVKGFSQNTYVYNAGNGPSLLVDLESNQTYIRSKSINDCYINVNFLLNAEIENIGNIYYKGNPATVNTNITGSGSLIKL